MKQVIVAAVSIVLLSGAGSSDWKYWGASGDATGKFQNFFEKNGIERLPGGHIKVWTKALDWNAVEKHKPSPIEMHQAVDRIGHYYFPELAKAQTLSKDQMMDSVLLEAVANGGSILPRLQTLFEIDCVGKMSRPLSIISNNNGRIQSSDKEGEWMHTAPDSSFSILAKILCPLT